MERLRLIVYSTIHVLSLLLALLLNEEIDPSAKHNGRTSGAGGQSRTEV
jgi:hypothetical protein